MIVNNKSKAFEPCPEYTGQAVCVDVTPLKKQQSQFGEREIFRIVFEINENKDDGNRYCVWSRGFTPSLNEKANFRKFLKLWLGRDLTTQELESFDTDSLIGKPAQLVVVHEYKDTSVFANIASCTPDKSGTPLAPSGKFVRAQDRKDKGDAGYSRSQPAEDQTSDHAKVKVHVGKHKGIELRELDENSLYALIEHWLPQAAKNEKPTADDKRLKAALEWFIEKMASKPVADEEEDNVPY